MKKKALVSLISGLALTSLVHASPIGVTVDIFCPMAMGSNALTNFGDYIAGYGYENLLSQNNLIYFKSDSVPTDLPTQLTNYFNEMVNYNSTTGRVTCGYVSNLPTEPRFTVSYYLTNGKGGAVQWQSSNSINIILPMGITA
ncbi:hypothetical protein GH742_02455 [Legionella sp. MW5194]|uniref:hypothetical protein n=1 Tax=Legionella sp. MW5194 TaxID=2662448 RepID=UPI00193E39AC|nr:hypothetical protein [Legionella sp. MW5194]QRN02824.1 hypothetical protein GH742_02455 [Legionella sp. MW5194]